MKLTRLGIIIPLFLLLVRGVGAQTYEPKVKVSYEINGIQYPTVISKNASPASPQTNKVDLEFDYSGHSSGVFPTHGNVPDPYQPVVCFWEFNYPSLGITEYSFEENPNHIFISGGNSVLAKAWTVDWCDDPDPPPKATSYESFKINYTSATNQARPVINNSSIKIASSWPPLEDEEMIYLVRLNFNCDSQVFGSFKFDYSGTSDMVSSSPVLEPSSGVVQGGTVVWDVVDSDLRQGDVPGMKYRDFYIRFKVNKGLAKGRAFECKASFTPNSQCICTVDPAPLKSDTVEISHDPNEKLILSSELICIDTTSTDVVVRYKLKFQNIGLAGASYVTVEDWIDEKSEIKRVEFIDSKHPVADMNFNSSDVLQNPTDGYAHWRFEYTGLDLLRGRGEAPYNIDFMDEATRGWLIFEVTYDKDVLKSCNALMNHARITFDCNPEFYTKTSMVNLSCDVSDDGTICPDCEELINEMITQDSLVPVQVPQPLPDSFPRYRLSPFAISRLTNLVGLNPIVNWYPDRWITNGDSLNATMVPQEDITYTLVASNTAAGSAPSCARVVYHIPIDVDDYGRVDENPMYIMDDTNQGDCTCTPVIIGGSPNYKYSWFSPTSNVSSNDEFITISQGNETYNLTVTDDHDCKEVFTTIINCSNGNGGDDLPWGKIVVGLLIGVALFWWLRNILSRGGG